MLLSTEDCQGGQDLESLIWVVLNNDVTESMEIEIGEHPSTSIEQGLDFFGFQDMDQGIQNHTSAAGGHPY